MNIPYSYKHDVNGHRFTKNNKTNPIVDRLVEILVIVLSVAFYGFMIKGFL